MISLARLRANVTGVPTDDVQAQELIDHAMAFIEAQTRHYFGLPITITEYLLGMGTRTLILSEPVLADTSELDQDVDLVEERAVPGGSSTIITHDQRQLRQGEHVDLLIRLGGAVWCKGYEYAVTYRRGYRLDEGPRDIERLLFGLIRFDLAFGGKTGMRSETIGGYSYTRFGDSDLDAIDGAHAILDSWRRVVFA